MESPLRAIGVSGRFLALCKDCLRRGESDSGFRYTPEWLGRTVDRGGTASDRCPACRRKHRDAIKALAVPYVDIETVGPVRDRFNPGGPLGGLGPLPERHERSDERVDLNKFAFGLTDRHATDLLKAFETHQVVVLIAGTGSGKSTFIPYRMLYPPAAEQMHLARRGQIIVTEPRREATSSTATMVATRLCRSTCGPQGPVGYLTGANKSDFHGDTNSLVYVTDGILVNWLKQGRLGSLGAVVIDEAHELNPNIEFVLGYLAHERHRFPDLRILIASATIDPQPFIEQFGGSGQVYLMSPDDVEKDFGYGHPLWPTEDMDPAGAWSHPQWHRSWDGLGDLTEMTNRLLDLRSTERELPSKQWRDEMPRLVAEQVLALLRGTDDGEILAFLPGLNEILTSLAIITPHLPKNVTAYSYLRDSSDDVKDRVKAAPRPGKRRVILATNVAETSLTIPGLRYVVDSGLIKRKTWDPVLAAERMETTAHSQFGMMQRWGRVGRTAPGWVFPLYTRSQYETLAKTAPPELTQANLESLLLTASAAGIADVSTLNFVGASSQVAGKENVDNFKAEVVRSARSLTARGAITEDGLLTAMGRELQFGTEAVSARLAMAVADAAGCTVEVASVLCLLSDRPLMNGLFRTGPSWAPEAQLAARRRHAALRLGCRDDVDLALRLMAGRDDLGDSAAFARRHWLNGRAVSDASANRERLLAGVSRKVHRIGGAHRPILFELTDRARAALFLALPDLELSRDDRGWRDVEDRLVVVESNVPAEVTSMLALTRSWGPAQAMYGSNLVYPATSIGRVTGRVSLQLAVASGREPVASPETAENWRARLAGAPIGSRVTVDTSDPEAPLVRALIEGPTGGPPVDEDDEDEADALADEPAEPDRFGNYSNEFDAGESDHLGAAGRADEPVLSILTPSVLDAAPVATLWDPARDRGESDTEFEVVRHGPRPGGFGAVVRPYRHGPPAEVGAEIVARVAEVSDLRGRILVEIVAQDGPGWWVMRGNDFSLNPRDSNAGARLRTGDDITITVAAGRRHGTTRANFRGQLGRYLQGIRQVAVTDAIGKVRRGYPATVVEAVGDWPRVRLDTARPEKSLVLEFGVPRRFFDQLGLAVEVGQAVTAFLSGTNGSVNCAVIPVGNRTQLPPRFDVDPERGLLTYRGEMSADVRRRLAGLGRGDETWTAAIDELWLECLPTRISGITLPTRNPADVAAAYPTGSVHSGTVTSIQPTSAIVRLEDSTVARIDRAAVGSGVVTVIDHLSVGAPVELTVRSVSTGNGEVRGSIELVVEPVLTQLLGVLGSGPVTGRVMSVAKGWVNVDLGGGLTGRCRQNAVGPGEAAEGVSLQFELADAQFSPDRRRPEVVHLNITLAPFEPFAAPPGGLGPEPLMVGTWPAIVAAVEQHRIQVEFVNGARKWIPWREVGQHGLIRCDRYVEAGTAVTVEAGAASHNGRYTIQSLKVIDLSTAPLGQQIWVEFGEATIDTVVRGTTPDGARAWATIWPAGKLDATIRTGGAGQVFTTGQPVRVRLRNATVRNGRVQVDVRPV